MEYMFVTDPANGKNCVIPMNQFYRFFNVMGATERSKYLVSKQATVRNSNDLRSLREEEESHYDEPTLKQELRSFNKGVPMSKDVYDQDDMDSVSGDVPYNPALNPETADDESIDPVEEETKKAGFGQYASLAVFVAIIFLGLKYVKL